MNDELAYLTLNLTITFRLPLDDPDTCFKQLDALRRTITPGHISQESAYLIRGQIDKAVQIIASHAESISPPDELE